jgi:shikimate dehydrogenase
MKITGGTQIVGVVGDPIAHTRSPAMHNAAFRTLGLDWVYVPFHVRPADLAAAVVGLRALGLRGVNATVPHKEALVRIADTLTPAAEFVGAVNTLTFDPDGAVEGDNTDAYGFVAAMQEAGLGVPRGERVVVVGAGGAARAVLAALAAEGVRDFVIVNRTPERALRLAEEVEQRTGGRAAGLPLTEDALRHALAGAALLVNTTSGGMVGKSPLDLKGSLLSPPLIVYDIVYAPPATPLLQAATARGCRTLNGVGMLVHQGARAFERWTGVAAPVEVMRNALLESLSQHRTG